MIETLIQGITIFILLIMIIKHIKPVVEKLTQRTAEQELKSIISEYDDYIGKT